MRGKIFFCGEEQIFSLGQIVIGVKGACVVFVHLILSLGIAIFFIFPPSVAVQANSQDYVRMLEEVSKFFLHVENYIFACL